MSYSEHLAEDRRLATLQLLDASPGYTGNEALLQAALEGFGHTPSADVVRGDLAWLQEAGLVTTADARGLLLATLTTRGQDVAAGRARHPGVKRRRA